jgi:hypothetical protein
MSIALVAREGNRFWVATNSTSARGGINIPNEYPPMMPIFKVNDVLVCFHGNHNFDDDILLKLDWSQIKSPLSERFLFDRFFKPMVALAEADSLISKDDDGTLANYPSSFLFLSSGASFSFHGDAIRKIIDFESIGTAEEPALGAFDCYFGKLSPSDLAVEVVRGGIRLSADTTHPILLASTDCEEMTIIEENGSTRKIRIPIWEKGVRK